MDDEKENGSDAVMKGKNNSNKLLPLPSSLSGQDDFVLYFRRWLVLGSFGLLSMSSAWIWMTFSPIAYPVANLWHVPINAVDALAGIYFYVYVPGSFISLSLVVNHLGLHRGLMIGGVLNATGALIRLCYMDNYRMVYLGTFLAATAQTFTLSTPPLIAGSWFGASERTTATALGVLANQLGTATGLGATIFVDFAAKMDSTNYNRDYEDNITVSESLFEPASTTTSTSSFTIHSIRMQQYLTLQATVAVVAFVLVVLLGGDQPPTPPSMATMLARYKHSDQPNSKSGKKTNDDQVPLLGNQTVIVTYGEDRDADCTNVYQEEPIGLSYLSSILHVFSKPAYFSFILSFGLSVGIYYTIPTFLSQLLPSTWTSRSVGWLGVMYQLMGVLGSFFCGLLVDWSQKHRLVCLSILFCSVLALAIYTFAEYAIINQMWAQTLTNSFIIVGVMGSGWTLAAWNTLGLEFGTALTYPADEAAVAGVLECAAELLGFVFVTLGGYLMASDQAVAFVGLLAVMAMISFLLLFANKAESKRPYC